MKSGSSLPEGAIPTPAEPLYFWVASGSRDEVPTRIELTLCARCLGMVPAEHVRGHQAWHRKLGD